MDLKSKIYRISEAARELGLSAEWLRQGEKRGSLPPARRDRNGHRYYTPEDIQRLRKRHLMNGMGSSRIAYRPPSELPSEQIRAARARAWIFVFDCYARKKAAPASRPDDAEGGSSDTRANAILPKEP
jgi:transposase-like protein